MKQSVMMKQFKLNETYSSLKKSCLKLSKELSAMKENNEQLKQRIKELESNNITKEEMKEMIKEGLTPITNVLIGKETEIVNAETQTDIAMKDEKKVQKIKGIKQVIESEELKAYNSYNIYNNYNDILVLSLIETEDKRIAIGGNDGSIFVSTYDLSEKKWNREIQKMKAHNYGVYSLCTLNGNRLLSGAGCSIKVWSLFSVFL